MADDELYNDIPCGYFTDRKAQEIIEFMPDSQSCKMILKNCNIDLSENDDNTDPQEIFYSFLLADGYRRSDHYIYKAVCPNCKKCLGIRIQVKDFVPSKSQRKAYRKNQDIEFRLVTDPKEFVTDEKVELLRKYDRRHSPDKKEGFEDAKESLFLLNGVIKTEEGFIKAYNGTVNIDFLLDGKLVGVSVLDRAKNALSSNYFYYDIEDEIMKRSIGVFSVLIEIKACRGLLFDGKLKSDLYYLGYYIEDCNKMNYKSNYNPHELLIDGEWIKK